MSAQDLRDEVLLATQSLKVLAELAQDAQDVQRQGAILHAIRCVAVSLEQSADLEGGAA